MARRPLTWLMYLFIFSACFNAVPLSFDVAGFHLRASEAMLLPVFGAVLSTKWSGRVSWVGFQLGLAGVVLWAAVLFWTVVNVGSYPSALGPLAHVGLLGLNLLHAAAIWLLVAKTGRWRQAVMCLLLSVVVLDGFLLVTVIGDAAGLSFFHGLISEEAGSTLEDVGDSMVPRFKSVGLIAGVMSAAALTIVAAWSLRPKRERRQALLTSMGIVLMIGLVLDFSRQAILSLVGGLGLIGVRLFLYGRLRGLLRVGVIISLVAVLGFGLIQFVPGGESFFQGFAGRALQIVKAESYSSGTVESRMTLWAGMWSDIVDHPLRGAGQDAYLKHTRGKDQAGSHNFPLEVLHASGVVGFLAYLYLQCKVMWWGWRALRPKFIGTPDAWPLLGVFGGFVAVWLASLSNLVFTAAVYWIMLGLLAAGARLAHSGRIPLDGRQEMDSL